MFSSSLLIKMLKRALLLPLCLAFLSACGGSNSSSQPASGELDDSFVFGEMGQSLRSARANSPYSDVLADCATRLVRDTGPCTFETLPLLGQSGEPVTRERIMERVVVSDTWMAENFESLLNRYPDEVIQLFASATMVVISSDIYRAFYTRYTGGIYFDPSYLWLTDAQRVQIYDYRDDFDPVGPPSERIGLPAGYNWGYGSRQTGYFDFRLYKPAQGNDRSDRSAIELEIVFASLMFHELAHALDVFPSWLIDFIEIEWTPWDASNFFFYDSVSSRLYFQDPLLSDELYEFAWRFFENQTRDIDINSLNANDLAYMFLDEAGISLYGHRDRFEDLAMIMEVTLMSYYYNIRRDEIFWDDYNPNGFCDPEPDLIFIQDYLAEPRMKARAENALARLIPNIDLSDFFQGYGDSFSILEFEDRDSGDCITIPGDVY